MWKNRRIAVVVPAFNEEDKIARALRSVPGFVDHVIVVDDASGDATNRLVRRSHRRGLELLTHAENRGVGAAIATGYRRAWDLGADVTCVMAGDSQMDPVDLPALIDAVVDGTDYAKGNRFVGDRALRAMPFVRLFGNFVLSWLTRIACGRFDLFDSQCGYTACNRRALGVILSGPIFPRYGYPNAILLRLCAAGLVVADVAVRPVYGPDWRSGIRPWKVAGPIAVMLIRGWASRLLRAVRRRPWEARATRLLVD